MANPTRIVQIGLGPLGQMLTPYLAERSNLQIVGAVDLAPEMAGRDLGELCGLGRSLGVCVTGSLDAVQDDGADVAVITTVSEFPALKPLLEQVLQKRLNVVSTCEELSYPWQTHPDLSKAVDAQAREQGVSVLATGVNPGFLMDFLPTAATAVCREVHKIRIERIQDATFRRIPFQQKIGAGLSVEAFEQRVSTRKLRHVGLTESMHMIAARLGWRLDRTEDIIEPVLAQTEVSAGVGTIRPGMATGVSQIGRGYIDGEAVLTLVFRATIGEQQPRDRVIIEGTPELTLTIPGGVNGDIATCSIVVNAIPSVVNAPPGLHTMIDIPPIACGS